ncbi:hypothetical protein OHF15_26740, partial [Escherichia coli]|uniref:hypothetical protein n=1 Tax=Escherichia coli TaxID=562 RepID=UPI0021E9892E
HYCWVRSYLPGSLQGKISSDGCLKKEQMVVSAIASTPEFTAFQIITINSEQTFELCALLTKRPFLHFHRIIIHY